MEILSEVNCVENRKFDGSARPIDGTSNVEDHFESTAPLWERVYHEDTLGGVIYQERMATALQWIEHLTLPRTARLLEVGCGAGLATAALSMRGYRVDAVDRVASMIELTSKRLAETPSANRVRLVRADVRNLPMPDNSFDLVLALGVLPWLDDPVAAVHEMARVTLPGGYVLVTADNSLHLDEILDPLRAPVLKPVRRCVRSALRAAKLLSPREPPEIHRHSRHEFDSILSEAGLGKLRTTMLGFGPFTLFGKRILSDSVGIKMHRLLQAAANRGLPIVSSSAMQYVVMSRKICQKR